jgi:ATP-dependent Clp endopeptidase proteolytic subunit ClpP
MAKRVNRDDIDKFHDYGLYIPNRTIYMGSEGSEDGDETGVDYLMMERFVKNLLILDSSSGEPITIVMNNTGGDEYHGLAIYDAIKSCRAEITIKVFGHAMSMGSIILQAADKRLMAKNSRQMIHYGTWAMSGHAKTAQKWAQEGLSIDKWMEKMYLKRIQEKNPTFTLDDLKGALDHDTFYTAEASVAMGLADGVIGESK